ncbi:DUF2029 domain-containing protein [bacterium]|nr:DUF2029 domain-containing protein [candidate division CSSED10-310 bacterium]
MTDLSSRVAGFPVVLLSIGICIHLMMLGSLLSEPVALEHGIHLEGSRSHPMEIKQCRGFLDAWFHDTDRVPRGLDFFSIYQAGRNFLRGQSIYYGVRVHNLGPEALVVPYFSGFRYLPAYACIFGGILNLLPPWPSYWSWIAIVEILLICNLYLIRRLPVSVRTQTLIMSMWLIYSPYYIELHIGQQSMVTATLIHLALIAHLQNKPDHRDACYIGSVLWKINTALYLPVFVKLRRWKTISILGILAILSSLPYFLLVPGSLPEFLSYFRHKFIAAGPNSLGLSTLIIQFLDYEGLEHATIKLILSFCSLMIITGALLSTMIPRKIRFDRALMIWVCIYFLTYKYVWEHHYIMILPVLSAGMVDKRLRYWTLALWLFCALPTPYFWFNNPMLAMPQLEWNLTKRIFYHSTKIIPLLVFFLRLVGESFRDKFTKSGSNSQHHASAQLDITGYIMSWFTSRKI